MTELERAARIVGRVMREGAYANTLLDQSHDPAGRVRALVHTTLRKLPAIDAGIEAAARRPPSHIDPAVRDLLRVVAADLEAGNPAPLVVDAGVEAVKRTAPRAGGFANAVLRRLATSGLPTGAEPELRWGIPGWLHRGLAAAWGEEEAAAFWEASNQPPPRAARLRPDASPPPGAQPVDGISTSYRLPPGHLPEGMVIQDPASTAVGLVAGPEAEARVLEIGAAPGGKTLHLLDQAPMATVAALDAHPRRTRSAAHRIPEASWVIGDGRRAPFPPSSFDLVVIDAPCSGLGTLRRRPELRHRVTPDEIDRLAMLQADLLAAALPLVAAGGRLVYSVCTVTPSETVELVAGRGFHSPEGLPGRPWGDGLLLAPHLTGTDGMFIAVAQVGSPPRRMEER